MLWCMRPHGSAQQLEARRRQAIELHRQGDRPTQIAEVLGVTPQAVGQWLKGYRRHGDQGMAAKPVPGRPAKLSARQHRRLAARRVRGALANGFATDLWTCRRIAQLIYERYGVRYHPGYVPRLLTGLGFSPSEAAFQRRRA